MQAPMDEFLRHFRPAEVLFNLGKLADAHRGLRIAFEIAERCSILSDVDLQDLAAKVKQCEEDGADANRATCKDSLGEGKDGHTQQWMMLHHASYILAPASQALAVTFICTCKVAVQAVCCVVSDVRCLRSALHAAHCQKPLTTGSAMLLQYNEVARHRTWLKHHWCA